MWMNRVHHFTDRNFEPTRSGEKIVPTYKLIYDDDGTQEVVESGKKNIYLEIQSHADSVDVHKIIEMCTMTNDDSPLYKTMGFYGDLVGFPTNYAEALQKLQEAENVWKALPVDVKEKFDNSVTQFYATAFSDEWINKIGIVKDIKEEKSSVSEVENE